MKNQKLKNKCARAIMTATQWRIENDMEGVKGYVLTFGRHCAGFAESLPEVVGRNPVCVDEDMDCFSPLDRNQWRCMTTPEKLPQLPRNGEHISVVDVEQMVLTFPEMAQRIKAWFAACTVPLDSSKWRRFEYITLGSILDYILRNRSANEVLS